jgi:hypothetical protein
MRNRDLYEKADAAAARSKPARSSRNRVNRRRSLEHKPIAELWKLLGAVERGIRESPTMSLASLAERPCAEVSPPRDASIEGF